MKENLSILLLEDVVADAVLIGHELQKGGISARAMRVETREQFLSELERQKPDIILSDHGLPSFDGFTALREARERCPDVPFIFVAQATGPEEVIRSHKNGATDFVLKSQISEQLAPAVRQAMSKHHEAKASSTPNDGRFRALVTSNVDYGIFLLDQNGCILSWNPGAERITSLKQEDAERRNFADLFASDGSNAADPRQLVASALRFGHVSAESIPVRGGGKCAFVDLSVTALPENNSPSPLLSVIMREVDSRQELQTRLDQAEQRCRERTADLDAAIKELDAFSYSVSHDLRAPLRHIDGFVEMLHQRLHSTLDESCEEYLSIISTAAQQMGTLIDALLSFSRISRAPLFKSRVPLEKVAHSVLRDLRFETEGREVNWSIDGLPVVEGDPTLLRQVLFNLIANALKFTRTRDKARVEVGVRDNQREWLIHVQDNGVGFDMQYAGKLFGVFQRLHPASEFEGTGIGLANVRRIIQRHGGRTWAEGMPDRGARFCFSLPRGDLSKAVA